MLPVSNCQVSQQPLWRVRRHSLWGHHTVYAVIDRTLFRSERHWIFMSVFWFIALRHAQSTNRVTKMLNSAEKWRNFLRKFLRKKRAKMSTFHLSSQISQARTERLCFCKVRDAIDCWSLLLTAAISWQVVEHVLDERSLVSATLPALIDIVELFPLFYQATTVITR